MRWRQNHLLNGSGWRTHALAIHSLASGLFLPFLVVYLIQAGHLSLVPAGAALLLGLAIAKLAPVGVCAMRGHRAVQDRRDPTEPALASTAAQ